MSACQIIAHRGGHPENTLAAFRWAQSYGVDAIEFDVHLTQDGYPMVFHDNTVDRLTTVTGNWLHLTRADVATVTIRGTQETIPDLTEALATITCPIFLEIKSPDHNPSNPSTHSTPSLVSTDIPMYPGIVEAIVTALRRFSRLESTVVISFDWSILEQIKLVEPRLRTGMLVELDQLHSHISPTATSITLEVCHHLLQWAQKLQCDWLSVDHHLIEPANRRAVISAVQADSRRLGVWTVNDDDVIKNWLEAGVNAITSDHPDLAKQIQAGMVTS
jgi:glycerophosphoryl diester phosphodiesterase